MHEILKNDKRSDFFQNPFKRYFCDRLFQEFIFNLVLLLQMRDTYSKYYLRWIVMKRELIFAFHQACLTASNNRCR